MYFRLCVLIERSVDNNKHIFLKRTENTNYKIWIFSFSRNFIEN